MIENVCSKKVTAEGTSEVCMAQCIPALTSSWTTRYRQQKFCRECSATTALKKESRISSSESTRFDIFFRAEVLTEPGVMLTKTPRIPGLDGRKMSKTYGNAITLSESDDDIRKKTKVMVTDPARKRRTDPGNPDVCPVYDWHKLFSPPGNAGLGRAGLPHRRHRLH